MGEQKTPEVEGKSITRRIIAVAGTAVFLGVLATIIIWALFFLDPASMKEMAFTSLGALIFVGKDIYDKYMKSGKS